MYSTKQITNKAREEITMIKALHVERKSCEMVYALNVAEAIEMFKAAGVEVNAVKEIGTADWVEVK